jgi:hypothetical protein
LRIRRSALVLLGALSSLPGAHPGTAEGTGTIFELPHPRLIVQLHPRADAPFTLSDIDRALAAGVHGIELDLRLRAEDGAVVCSHSRDGLEGRPTLSESIERILERRRGSGSVLGDGLQFFIVLDPKEHSPRLYRGIVEALRRHVDSWSTAAPPGGPARGITVVVSGEAQGLAGFVEPATLDSLCILEGTDYRDRIRNISPEPGRFQWISIQHPGERGRVLALHWGVDLAKAGEFNVRVYDCHRSLAACAAAGADAVNADLDELPVAVRLPGTGSPR